jgi:hypothetical protein
MKNYINKTFSTIVGRVIVVIICLVIGFFGGMEYKAYQIRSVLKDTFSGAFGETTGKPEKKISEDNPLTKKVTFEITNKGFSDEDFQTSNTFTFKFTNTTGKDIEGIKGTIEFNDLFGDRIKGVSLSYDEGIKAGESKLYRASLDYNQFMDDDVKLRQTELVKLKYNWDLSTIIYTDGTVENF